MSPRRADETVDFAVAQQQITVIDEPGARARHEFGIVERRGGFAPEIGDEAALGMFARLRPAEREQGSRLMIEQRASPPVERTDRSNPRRRASQLAAEMLQHPGRDDLYRIERAAGHLEEADMEGERQPVQHSPAATDGGKLVLTQREEVLGLHRRQRVGKSVPAEIAMLPSAHPRALSNRTGAPLTAALPSAR